MAIINASDLTPGTVVDSDVCVIGGGVAGVTVARELARAGKRVCLAESGGFEPDPAVQALYEMKSTGYPQRPDFMSRARYFGGSCNLWAGRSMALAPLDVAERPWVPGGAWPIAYEELARYYPAAAAVLGLPQCAQDPLAVARHLSPDERRLLDTPDMVPTLSLWGRRALRLGAGDARRLASMPGASVLLSASATELRTHESGERVAEAVFRTLSGIECRVRAQQFVIACGGLETARLLLVSRDRHQHGIGNEQHLVGRFFMDHPRAVFGKVHLSAAARLRGLRGRPVADGKLQVGLGFAPELQRREGLLNHYVTLELQTSGYTEARYQSFVQTMKVLLRRGHAGSRLDLAKRHLGRLPEMIYLLSPKELMPHPLYRLYVALRDTLPRRPVPQTFVPVYFCEQPPDSESRVTLGADRDALGMQRLVLDWRIDDSVYRGIDRLQELLARRLRETGLGSLEPGQGRPGFTDASHHMGTTRMSQDPRRGVVDAQCRVHGTGNLFVAGSAVFPSAGHANPTWTIIALALRLANHLKTAAAH